VGPDREANKSMSQIPGAEKKLVAGILGILIGSLGIHKFYLGYQTAGIIMLLVTLLTCGLGASVMGIIGLVEGIIYLTKPDEEFVEIYVDGKKEWF
jgi:TM2 domain-containing membrane protein YozV